MVPNVSRNIGVTWTSIPQKKDAKISLFKKKAYIYASLKLKNIANHQETDVDASVLFHENMLSNRDWAVVQEKTEDNSKIYETGIEYSIIRLYLMRLRGLGLYAMKESYFTDYQLPIIIAIFAIILAILI